MKPMTCFLLFAQIIMVSVTTLQIVFTVLIYQLDSTYKKKAYLQKKSFLLTGFGRISISTRFFLGRPALKTY